MEKETNDEIEDVVEKMKHGTDIAKRNEKETMEKLKEIKRDFKRISSSVTSVASKSLPDEICRPSMRFAVTSIPYVSHNGGILSLTITETMKKDVEEEEERPPRLWTVVGYKRKNGRRRFLANDFVRRSVPNVARFDVEEAFEALKSASHWIVWSTYVERYESPIRPFGKILPSNSEFAWKWEVKGPRFRWCLGIEGGGKDDFSSFVVVGNVHGSFRTIVERKGESIVLRPPTLHRPYGERVTLATKW